MENIVRNADNNIELIIPIAAQDIDIAMISIPFIKKYIEPTKIYIISNSCIKKTVEAFGLEFIDENKMVEGLSFEIVRDILKQYGAEKRTGWYFQQFLKMAYSQICGTDYYLSWDADTIPLRTLSMFCENGIPILNMKREYHKPYFDTIENLFGIKKNASKSFIAEHMIFNKTIMIEIISNISQKSNGVWFENIIKAIPQEYIQQSGFSEFETYGTYVLEHYPQLYEQKEIRAVRKGKMIFGAIPDSNVLTWLSKHYLSISFEKTQDKRIHTRIYTHTTFRRFIPSCIFVNICLIRIKVSGWVK